MRYTVFETAWGYAGFAAGSEGIARLCLPVRRRDRVAACFCGAVFDAALMRDVQKAMRQYFEGQEVDFRVWPTANLGRVSEFGIAILKECRRIEYGLKVTYGELAGRAGRPGAARAVGTVLGRNPVPLIVPCHRILRAGGQLGGFSGAGGVNMKKRLLALESSG
jgi:methylated-DNA-[protein]-cysteine S-methyltransferase